jgi:amidophosphoribosyltransferase
VEEIRAFAGLDSLGYLSIDSLKQAIDIPEHELCLACFNGKYPVPIDETFSKYCMESA